MSTLTVSERLGEALERVHALQAENDALLATRVEADRLTDANREIARLETICRRLETERFDAVARNARLEAALRRITDAPTWTWAEELRAWAQAALGEQPEGGSPNLDLWTH